jgi:acyl-CoA synthetase (AMP-forming)/AMP-acid ligase II
MFVGVNSVAVPITLFGCALAGRAFVPVNYRLGEPALRHFANALGVGIAVTDARYAEAVQQALGRQGVLLSTDEVVNVEQSAQDPVAEVGHDDVAVFIFTSGTSTAPKAVRLRHRHLASYVMQSVDAMSEGPESASLIAAPNYHIATIANVLTSVYSGRRMVFQESFVANDWLLLAQRESVTHAFVVPTMLHRLVVALRHNPGLQPKTLRTLAYGGAPANLRTVAEALDRFGPETGLVNAYGLTETSSTVTVLGPEDHRTALSSSDPQLGRRLGSVGRAVMGVEVRLANTPIGEILVRGPHVSAEYHEAASRIDAEGWFHTGDIGEFDIDGYLYVRGRQDDLIIRGGENISPLEIEDVLRTHPSVADAAVVGVEDPEWGERIEAMVELQGAADEEELIAWARNGLSSFKVPERVHVVRELPRNELGKVLRPAARALLSKRGATVSTDFSK